MTAPGAPPRSAGNEKIKLMNRLWSRREFLKLAGLGGITLGATSATIAASEITTEKVELSEVDIRIGDLPANFVGYRIGFISDMHVGRCLPADFVESAVSILHFAHPDLILIGGDFIWVADRTISQVALASRYGPMCFRQGHSYQADLELAKQVYALIGDLFQKAQVKSRNKDGVYAVYGNHDHWVAPNAVEASLANYNIQVLVNEAVRISRGEQYLTLLGTDDLWTGIPSTRAVKDKKEANEVRVVLSHNPDYLSQLLRRGVFQFDLGLAGHTHGGQVKLPWLGALHYNVRDRRLAEGLFQHPQGASVYTSRGIGVVGFPVRINCPPEVNIFTLKQA